MTVGKKEVFPRPVFGELPPRGPQGVSNRRVFRYAELLHKIREYPTIWAKIATFEDGSPAKTLMRINTVSGEINRYLTRSFPLEVWDISRRRVQETWATRELWVRYNGIVTVEQAEQLRAARREVFQKGKVNGERKRAARETAARIQALAVHKEIRELRAYQRSQQRED